MVSTAIIGIGNIGKRVAHNLVAGGETVFVCGNDTDSVDSLAAELGPLAGARSVLEGIRDSAAVLFAVPFDAIKMLLVMHAADLTGRIVIDPSNAIEPDGKGGFKPMLETGLSAGRVIADLLPSGVHYVKAFGSVAADSLTAGRDRKPERAVLFYATDDDVAGTVAERLISTAGFEPVKAGGVDDAGRIEVFGDLHELGGLGRLVSGAEARAALRRRTQA